MIGPAIAAMALLVTPATDRAAAEAAIRSIRAASNAAIAAHDLVGMKAAFLPDYHVLPGSSGAPFDLSTFDARIGHAFADPTFVTYVRTPDLVVIGRGAVRAVETGRWTGVWRKPDGEMRLTGMYQAMWLPTPAGWRLKNESFVTLDCTGSKDCAAAL